MIRVKHTITVNKNVRFIDTRDSIISHFGINPKNGGRPPKERNEIKSENLIKELLLNITNIWLMWNKLNLLKSITIVAERKQ